MVSATEAMVASHADLQRLAAADRDAVDRLRRAATPSPVVIQVPFFREDIHDVAALSALGSYLAASTEPPLARVSGA